MSLPTAVAEPAGIEVRRRSRIRAVVVLAVAAAVVAIHDGLVRMGVGELDTLVTNGAFVVALLGAARWAGVRRRDVGLAGPQALRASRTGQADRPVPDRRLAHLARVAGAHATFVLVLVAVAVVAIAAAAVAAVSGQEPMGVAPVRLSLPDILFRVLVAIPFGTAVCEEVVFRGVVLATSDRLLAPRWSTAVTSIGFGLWHVAAEAQRVGGGSVLGVVPGVLATAAASAFVLCPLRRRTGGLLAPIALHAATNVTAFLAVVLAGRFAT